MDDNLFASFTPESYDRLKKYFEIQSMPEGKMLIKQDTKVNGMHILHEGEVIVQRRMPGGQHTNIATISPPGFIGEVNFLDGSAASATVIARRDGTSFFLSRDKFFAMGELEPDIFFQFSQNIVKNSLLRISTTLENNHDLNEEVFIPAQPKKLDEFKAADAKSQPLHEYQFLLKHREKFSTFTLEELNTFLTLGQYYHLPRNCCVYSQRQNREACYLVLQGCVQQIVSNQDRFSKYALAGPGEFFGVEAVSAQLEYLASAYTRENTILFEFSRENLLQLQSLNKNLYYKVAFMLFKLSVLELKKLNSLVVRLLSLKE